MELRLRVFCGEQGVDPAAEVDALDDAATHVVAVQDDSKVVATCRLIFNEASCRLGRMAVAPERRGEGVGRDLLGAAEREARRHGAEEIVLHSQTRAAGFYAGAGYGPHGDVFLEEGIEHVRMTKSLRPPA